MASFDPDALLAELDNNVGTDELDSLMSELSALEVTNTPRSSQGYNELDNLMNQLGDPKPNNRAPSQLSQSNVKANDGMDELDQLMNSFSPSTPQKTQPVKSHDTDDLDSLMSQLGAPVVAQGTRQQAPVRANTVAVSSKPAGVAGNDDLDTLMAELSGPTPTPAARGGQAPRGISTAATQPPVRGGDDDLDALMNQLGGPASPVNRGAPSRGTPVARGTPVNRNPAPVRGSPAARGGANTPVNTDASDLDNLLNELGSSTPTNSRPASTRPLGQSTPVNRPPAKSDDDLDALMNQLGGPASQPRAQPTGINKAATLQPYGNKAIAGDDDLDALMNQLGGPAQTQRPASVAPNRTAAPTVRTSPSTPVNRVPSKPEDDLDALMNQLGANPASPVVARTASSALRSSGGLPAAPVDDLDALMNQLGGPAQGSPANRAAPRGISQSATARPAQKSSAPVDDLDALMNQLGGPTPGSPANRAAPRGISQSATARPAQKPVGAENDLDALMNQLSGPTPGSPGNRAVPRGINHAATARPVSNSSSSELDDLMNQLGGSSQPPARGINQSSSVRSTSSVQSNSSDLDDLMNQLGGGSQPPARGINQSSSVRSTSSVRSSSSDLDDLMATLEPASGTRSVPSGGFGRGGPGSPAVGRGINNQPSYNAGRGAGVNTQSSYNSNSFSSSTGGQTGFNNQPYSPSAGRGRGQSPAGSPPVNTYSPRTPGHYPPAASGSPRVGRGGPGSDLNSLLGSLNEQMGSINDGNTASRGICGFCQKHILSECIQALGKTFHPEHFVCFTCQSPLGTSSFYETNGEPNCEKCYQSMYCPMCAFCQKPISDRCVTAMNKKWHVECFVCNSCCNSFQGGSFFEKNGMPYCQNCFHNTFATRCAGCQQVTTGRIINALNQQWHQECFACAYCRRPFNGQAFYEKDGKPYCEAHYHTASGAVCAGCKEAIVGRCVDALGKKYHPEHFICNYCLNPLAGGGYTEQNGAPYCQECYVNLF